MLIPLAERLRPNNLNEFIGQNELVSEFSPIQNVINTKTPHSMIFWGPPGTGKTTLARIIASKLDLPIHEFSAVNTGLGELKEVLGLNKKTPQLSFGEEKTVGKTKLFFIDEIHRFNKAQQDFLLPFVENGKIVLIGATTENPSFEIINALLSRTKVYVFGHLTNDDLEKLLKKAEKELKFGEFKKDVKEKIIDFANGDGRKLINTLEQIKGQNITFDKITKDLLSKFLSEKTLKYDKNGEEHYNIISAFIKSMRASDPDASLYYLARMLNGREDPKFIIRRMIVFASEDIGLANNNALQIATSAKDAIDFVGMPEAQIILGHIVCVLALSPKSRDSYNAYFSAKKEVEENGDLEIPMHLRNAPTKLMKELGYNKQENGQIGNLPNKLTGKKFLND